MNINETPDSNRPNNDDNNPAGVTEAAITAYLDNRYRPRGKAAQVWSQYRDLITPWIAACSAGGTLDAARRNAGTFLNYLAWAMTQVDNIEDCLSEEMFDRFCEENPAGLTNASFAHARCRCRKVLDTRAALLNSQEATTATSGGEYLHGPGAPTAPTRVRDGHRGGEAAWHARGAGNLASWGSGYEPTSPAANRVWKIHRAVLEPWIAASHAVNATDARRTASAVLELIAWAMPLLDDLDACLTEETLQLFLDANPTKLGDGARANVRGRVRRVMKARRGTVPSTNSNVSTTTGAASIGNSLSTSSARRAVPSRVRQSSRRLYDHDQWARLVEASKADGALREVLRSPWRRPGTETWARARAAARDLAGIDLRQWPLRLTIRVHAFTDSSLPLAENIRLHQLDSDAATEISLLLPDVDEQTYIRVLRGDDCTSADDAHIAARLGADTGTSETGADTGGDVPSTDPSGKADAVNPTPEPKTRTNADRRSTRKPSARQIRLARRIKPTLPDEIQDYIRNRYKPKSPIREHWDAISHIVEESLAASRVRDEDSMRKHVTHLAHFYAWAHSVGLPLDLDTLTRANMVTYEHESLVHLGQSTQQERRWRLARVADQLHPEQAEVRGEPIGHRKIVAPYSPSEMAIIRRVAQTQPTDLLRRQVCLHVGLGAGAGIDSSDLKRLHQRDVVDHGERGIQINVTNPRRVGHPSAARPHQRTVWVLREYEDLVRIGLGDAKPDDLLLGRKAERANVAASVFSRAALYGDVPAMSQWRLRSTWMTTHLGRPTPLNVLLQAAGLATARTLIELLPYVPSSADQEHRLR